MTFEAKLSTASLDDITLVSFESSPMTVSHTSRHIAGSSVRRWCGDELLARAGGGYSRFSTHTQSRRVQQGGRLIMIAYVVLLSMQANPNAGWITMKVYATEPACIADPHVP
jgi:hypothetical protein